MNILALLPDTHAGRQTGWLWSWMLAIAEGSPPPDPDELATHFASSVFEQVLVDQLIAHFAQLASNMPLVTQLVQEASSNQRYSALLRMHDFWLRYTCLLEEDEPYRLIGAAFTLALDPNGYLDRRVQRDGRDVQIRDFGGMGPLVLLWHGAGGDLTDWETLVPYLADFHLLAQDLPGHGRSPLKEISTADALADADAVVAELDQGLPTLVGHSLGGYLGLRYAATRRCFGWIGLDGPLGLVYPWEADDPGGTEISRQIGREIRAVDVVSDFAAIDCRAMLLLCAAVDSPIEEQFVSGRWELAEHIARHHPKIRVEWVQSGHDTIVIHQPQVIGASIRDFLCQPDDDGKRPAAE